MIREAPLKFVVVYSVEFDNDEAFAKALEYVAKRMETARLYMLAAASAEPELSGAASAADEKRR
jgi:ferredoxin-NADP reductase